MPLPWAVTQQRKRIKEITDRAITIKQLDSLRTWLQRLCKARLLKDDDGQPINWYDINLYDLTAHVIKKVIPQIDPEIKDLDGKVKKVSDVENGKYCSWMEFVSVKEQKPKILISHWWGGRFRDFMHIIDMMLVEKCLSVNTGLWVCTFANCQWGENFGITIMECPFVKAIQVAEYTLLIVDREAGSLKRTWCGLELFSTVDQEKPLQVYTPAGQVGGGSARATSGPLIEAIKEWDIRKTEASDESYRRQIFNYIGKVNEREGLQTDSSGCELLLDFKNRPMLADQEEDDLWKRAHDKPELKHEAELFVKAGQHFEKLNMTIRLEVIASIGRAKKAHSCLVDDVAHRGITLGQWRALARKLEQTCDVEWFPTTAPTNKDNPGGPRKWEEVDLYNVQKQYLDCHPEMDQKGCSYAELINERALIPEVYVNYWQGMKLKDIISAVDWFAEAHKLSDSTVLWINNLAYRCKDELPKNERVPKDLQDSTTQRVMAECSCMVMLMVKEPASMLRLWRLYEMELAGRCGLDVYLACATGALACNANFATGTREFGVFISEIGDMISQIDVQSADSNNKDKGKILEWFRNVAEEGTKGQTARGAVAPASESAPRGHEGFGGPGACGPFERIHCRLTRWGAGPMLRRAAATNDEATIIKVLRVPGVMVNSEILKGSLGEGAIHIAAATGSTNALRILLARRADPNLEDAMWETPLHYTALAGQAECARLLLKAGADPHNESSFVETPLEVARQNPAAFLGVNTTEVQQVLKDACDRFESLKALPAVKEVFKDHLKLGSLSATELTDALNKLIPEIEPGDLGGMLSAAGWGPGSDVNCDAFLEWLYR